MLYSIPSSIAFLLLFGILPLSAQTSPSLFWIKDANGTQSVSWDTVPGVEYKLQRSRDLRVWTTKSTHQGFGQTITLQVPVPVPVSSGTGALSQPPTFMFSITPDETNTGMTYVSWLKEEGQSARVYESLDFSWHDTIPLSQTSVLKANGQIDHAVLLHKIERTIPLNASTFTVASLSPEDAAIYQRLTAAHPQIIAELNGPNGIQTTQTGNVPGNPGSTNFYRVLTRSQGLDSDDDHLPDSFEAAESTVSPYDPDTDGNGVTDPWSLRNHPDLIISEFIATNDNTLFDENEDDSDWIEIFNPTNRTINLSGWWLSDKTDNPQRWRFPVAPTDNIVEQLVLAPGESLIVFASGKDRRFPSSELHTNFGLNDMGEDVLLSKPLVDPEGDEILNTDDDPIDVLVDAHDFPAQRKNTSGGWAFNPHHVDFPNGDSFSRNRYFVNATPGVTNPPGACPGLSGSPTINFYDDLPNDVLTQGLLFPRGYGSVTVQIIPPDFLPQTLVYYSLDGSDPNAQSILYTSPFLISETTVVRAVAFQPNCDPSTITARSFLSLDSILGTAPISQEPTDHQQRPSNWPSIAVGIPDQEFDRRIVGELDFAVDPLVVASESQKIEDELFAHPIISITGSLGKFFDLDTGLYSNSSVTNRLDDPLENDWGRLISVEYFDPAASGSYVQENAELKITGHTSRAFTATSKQSLRLRFRARFSKEGESNFEFEESPFFTGEITKFKELLLRNPTHDSWLLKWHINGPRGATYIRTGWLQRLHAEMGRSATGVPYLEAHRRWVHVFLNGLYWGAYELSERVDDDFGKSYLSDLADYDVFKYSGNNDGTLTTKEKDGLTDGDYAAWDVLRFHCQTLVGNPAHPTAPVPPDPAAWPAVLNYLDLGNYIDYLLVQMYANVRDWPDKNFRILRRRGKDEILIGNPVLNPGGKFQFLVWDAEASLDRNNRPTTDKVFASTDVVEFHQILLGHSAYRQAFQDRVDLHFNDPGGILTPPSGGGLNPGYQLLQTEMDRFGGIRDGSGNLLTPGLLTAESARWGDGNPDLTLSLGYDDTPEYGPGWKTRAERIRDTYDNDRRQEFLDAIGVMLTPPVAE